MATPLGFRLTNQHTQIYQRANHIMVYGRSGNDISPVFYKITFHPPPSPFMYLEQLSSSMVVPIQIPSLHFFGDISMAVLTS